MKLLNYKWEDKFFIVKAKTRMQLWSLFQCRRLGEVVKCPKMQENSNHHRVKFETTRGGP